MTDLRPAHLRPADIEALRACGAVVRCDTDRCAARYSTQVRADEKRRTAKARAVREACAGRWYRDGAAHRCGSHALAEARR